LEFGGGQSTLWWSGRARRVVTFEGDEAWYRKIKGAMPDNVELHYVSMKSREANVCMVNDALAAEPDSHFDVIVIDGLCRDAMVDIACRFLARDGVIVCDNAEGYGICNAFIDRGLRRVDFYGLAPGVVDPHCTSIYFGTSCFVFDPAAPIHAIATD
jgi:predicted O-methyltransferase YrrM